MKICVTASYDMTVAMWNWKINNPSSNNNNTTLEGEKAFCLPCGSGASHEFRVGLDVSILNRGEL